MEFWIEEVFFFLILTFRENGQNSMEVYPSRDGNDDPTAASVFQKKKYVCHQDYKSFFGASRATIAAV